MVNRGVNKNFLAIRIFVFCLSVVSVSASPAFGKFDLPDLKLSSVEIVDLKDQAAIIAPLSSAPLPSRALIKVEFSISIDLADYARRHGYNVSNAASICGDEDLDSARRLQGYGYTFDDLGIVDSNREASETTNSEKRFIWHYYMYINLKYIKLAGDVEAFVYDLGNDPTDVCVRLSGGNMMGDKFYSGTLRIPRNVLIDALLGHKRR